MSAEGARKARIAAAFSAQAGSYESVGEVQREVAMRLARRIGSVARVPRNILEIGCGTGFLSVEMARIFPDADLLLSDISPAMLACASARVRARGLVLDGEHPQLTERFDLIVSSLALQWFGDLQAGLARLAGLLAPGGRLMFATLGADSFKEWRQAHAALGLACGTPEYPGAENFPWPPGVSRTLEAEPIVHAYADGMSFIRSLKALGAREPVAGYRPLSPGNMRRVLASFEDGISITYQILYGAILRD